MQTTQWLQVKQWLNYNIQVKQWLRVVNTQINPKNESTINK